MENITAYQNYLKNLSLKNTTIQVYLWHLRHFFAWLDKQELSEKNLKSYYQYLLKRYRKIASINLRLVIINSYLKYIKHKWQFDLLTTEKNDINILTKKQIQDILNLASQKNNLLGLRDKIVLELLYYAGLKSGQLINLKRDQINLVKNYLKIDQQKISLPETTKFYLTKYLNKRTDDASWLLINLDRAKKNNSQQLSVRSVERIIEKYSRQMPIILNITPQTLRDTRAYHLKKDGGSAKAIKDALQFKTKTAAEIYFKKL